MSLRLPWAMNFCPFRACPLKRALIERFSACEKSVAIRCAGGASKPSSRQRSKSKQSVKRPIRAHRCNYLPFGRWGFAESRVF